MATRNASVESEFVTMLKAALTEMGITVPTAAADETATKARFSPSKAKGNTKGKAKTADELPDRYLDIITRVHADKQWHHGVYISVPIGKALTAKEKAAYIAAFPQVFGKPRHNLKVDDNTNLEGVKRSYYWVWLEGELVQKIDALDANLRKREDAATRKEYKALVEELLEAANARFFAAKAFIEGDSDVEEFAAFLDTLDEYANFGVSQIKARLEGDAEWYKAQAPKATAKSSAGKSSTKAAPKATAKADAKPAPKSVLSAGRW